MLRAAIILLAQGTLLISAYQMYQENIPHGSEVPDPCNPGQIWGGVGHHSPSGGDARNPFGLDFAANNHKWNVKLCRKDSDGDGRTNGEELGDPDCKWTKGSTPVQSVKGHPGICEPLDSAKCKARNTFISCSAPTTKSPATNSNAMPDSVVTATTGSTQGSGTTTGTSSTRQIKIATLTGMPSTMNASSSTKVSDSLTASKSRKPDNISNTNATSTAMNITSTTKAFSAAAGANEKTVSGAAATRPGLVTTNASATDEGGATTEVGATAQGSVMTEGGATTEAGATTEVGASTEAGATTEGGATTEAGATAEGIATTEVGATAGGGATTIGQGVDTRTPGTTLTDVTRSAPSVGQGVDTRTPGTTLKAAATTLESPRSSTPNSCTILWANKSIIITMVTMMLTLPNVL